MPIYTYSCPVCQHEAETYQSVQEAFGKDSPDFHCKDCHAHDEKVVKMERVVSMPAPARIGPGRSDESKKDWADKRKRMLEARSLAHDKSPDGMEQRLKSILRLKKNGTLL